MVLTALISKLRLQEKVRARDNARAVSGGEPLTDSGLEVMPALIAVSMPRKPIRSASSTRAWVRSSFHAVP
jgi:hypothetical protein